MKVPATVWNVSSLSPEPFPFKTDDFRSYDAFSVKADGVLLLNNTAAMKLDDETFQASVCQCGIAGCAAGSFFTVRKVGESFLWIPAIETLDGNDHFTFPPFFASPGMPLFSAALYEELRAVAPDFPTATDVSEMTGKEWLCTLQLLAPHRVLGRFPEPARLDKKILLSANDDLDAFLERAKESGRPLKWRKASPETHDLLLDVPELRVWTVFGRLEDETVFYLPELGLVASL